MERLDLVGEFDDFLEKLHAVSDVTMCIEMMCEEFEIDFATYHLAFHEGKAIDTPYVKTNYPAEWVRQYLISGYVDVDPVAKAGFSLALPCHWRDLDWSGADVVPFLEDAHKHGVGGNGFLIPVTDKRRRRAMVNFASTEPTESWDEKIGRLAEILTECAHIVHRKAILDLYGEEDVRPSLSPRELQCLTWVAKGKDGGAIALILGISEHTVRDYCKSAKHKLGVATLFQAIHKATMLRVIDPNGPE